MTVKIQPSHISGTVQAPTSKSSMQRACAAALLVKGKSIIRNPGSSHDDLAALKMIEALGARIEFVDEGLVVQSEGVMPISNEVNIGESGLGIRMFTPIIALSDQEITVHGKGSLMNRPMDFFNEILPQLQVQFTSNHGKLPFTIQGPLVPQNISIDGSLSSQFLTGMLMAYASLADQEVVIKVNELKSKPYIDLTLHVLKEFGLNVPENKNYEEFVFHPKTIDSGSNSQEDNITRYTVEGDWSGGAFLLVAGAIAGSVTVVGLDMLSAQADKAIVDVLMQANASMAMEAKGIKIHKSPLTAFEFDATDCPDLFPPLVALAAYCNGDSTISGVTRLMHKESDRAITLQQEFGKMGVEIILEGDVMTIKGGSTVKGAKVHSHNDHRIAMSCAVAGLAATGATEIEQAEAINKSYPGFYSDLKNLGAALGGPFIVDYITFDDKL